MAKKKSADAHKHASFSGMCGDGGDPCGGGGRSPGVGGGSKNVSPPTVRKYTGMSHVTGKSKSK